MKHNSRKPGAPHSEAPPPGDASAPLEVEGEDEHERVGYGLPRTSVPPQDESPVNGSSSGRAGDASHETRMEEHHETVIDRGLMGAEAGHLSDILNWALDSIHEPAAAAADWLARDIDPEQPTAVALLSDPQISLARVKQAKSVFKTMRIVGEKSADRRIGARMYAASIAAGLVRHRKLVSRQSEEALARGFQGLLDDHRMPSQLRDLAGMALCVLRESRYEVDAGEEHEPHAPRPSAAPKPASHGRAAKTGKPRGK